MSEWTIRWTKCTYPFRYLHQALWRMRCSKISIGKGDHTHTGAVRSFRVADYGQWRGGEGRKHGLPGCGRELRRRMRREVGIPPASSVCLRLPRPSSWPVLVFLPQLSFSFNLWLFSCSVSAFSNPGTDLCELPLCWAIVPPDREQGCSLCPCWWSDHRSFVRIDFFFLNFLFR